MRVVVAMSGGVDSAVTAALLAGAGHDVIGITLQLYDHGAASGRKGACCAGQDIYDAKAVADCLGIRHYVIDAEERFHQAVIENFAASYAAGVTPVPCVRCNQSVKFTDLLALARDLGAEALATGHYVRRLEKPDGIQLCRAKDLARDQSWFLFATTCEQLAFCRFPLGEMDSKATVRRTAAQFNLPVANKPDSQDLCFAPSGHYAELVSKLHPEAGEEGEILTEDGALLGRHSGIAHFTVGQAKRLGPARVYAGRQQVVVAIDAGRRRVIVGPRDTKRSVIRLHQLNWLIEAPDREKPVDVKLRARDNMRRARVVATGTDTAEVIMDEPALPAPGQACVFYEGERVLGGGFILEAT